MSVAVLYSRASSGLHAPLVHVEAHLSSGLPRFSIVGLPETAVKESKDRVRGAIIQMGCRFPRKRIIINLAPADLPKEGGRYDLPIALCILIASGQLHANDLSSYEFAGELSLNGDLRYTPGLVPFALATYKHKRKLILPSKSADDAALLDDLTVLAADNLHTVCQHLSGHKLIEPFTKSPITDNHPPSLCLSDVCGQRYAKRALEIAASGEHSLLMMGPPGTGKTMLASRMSSLLPPLSWEEAIEVAAIYSVSKGQINIKNFLQRPFRRPHHTSSPVSLIGGGSHPKPGEISLAHLGILFLDELGEFDRKVLEVLREPLEFGKVCLSRARGQAEYPAQCILVAAMNPCPCGYLGDNLKACHCREEQIKRYRYKISGPLLDRIDMHIEVARLPKGSLGSQKTEESSIDIRERVFTARSRQVARSNKYNAQYTPKDIKQYCQITSQGQKMLDNAMEKLGLSARAYHRILKVARTIADLSNEDCIQDNFIAEAIQYRQLDKHMISS